MRTTLFSSRITLALAAVVALVATPLAALASVEPSVEFEAVDHLQMDDLAVNALIEDLVEPKSAATENREDMERLLGFPVNSESHASASLIFESPIFEVGWQSPSLI